MVTGSKGISVILFSLEFGIPKAFRFLEEHTKCLAELIVFLNQRLVIYLAQKGCAVLVLRWSWNEMPACFKIKSLLIGQHLIPDIPAAAKGFFKQLGLGCIGIEPDFDCDMTYALVSLPCCFFAVLMRFTPIPKLRSYGAAQLTDCSVRCAAR